MQPAVLRLTLRWLAPTHELDPAATALARSEAVNRVPRSEGDRQYASNQVIVTRGEIRDKDFHVLRAESEAFARQHGGGTLRSWAGTFLLVSLLTLILCTYVVQFQPRIVRNHARAFAVVGLMLATLLVAQLAGLGSSPLYVFGVAPTLLVAMIMAIVYDRRFAVGVGTVHALLVTLGLNESVGFTLVLLAGVVTACVLLDDVRTRSKMVEVGGLAAIAMILATVAVGLGRPDPASYVFRNAMLAGAAGFAVGFIVLGVLSTIEKTFRITTSLTLVELADSGHKLLRMLAAAAPGTWNHSQQVAAIAEEAAEAIGANSLLCRVGSYYHDVGKLHKPEYFVENQYDGVNRHQTISPSVSVLIIIGHVKDGIELAKAHKLPTSIYPFIQQHHGTTLVEFFYDRAKRENDPQLQAVSEMQYRYPGPKPKTREIAIVMLCDCCESAARSLTEPTPGRIESLVNDLAMKRLHDGQFDECDLTMRDLELVKRSIIKSLLGIYHGRIVYPSTAPAQAAPEEPNIKTA
jgi:putative nucleotidyltransferase with HDIG domain